MKRLPTAPRQEWKEKAESLGFFFHSLGGSYWNEGAYYRFEADEIAQIEKATNELHEMCLEAVDYVIEKDLFGKLHIPVEFVPLIHRSWARDEPGLYGRFDLAFDGSGPPKMLEYNADTPTSLLEASLIQWHWKEDAFPGADQFNSLHEKLVAAWKNMGFEGTKVYFSSVKESEEDLVTIEYMRDLAIEAGLNTEHIYVEEIGWQPEIGKFMDLQDLPINVMFKLYPWEWLVHDAFGPNLLHEPIRLIEPIWKMILSNKGILPILWEMFPGHPNLLPTYWTPEKLGNSYVQKPLLSREGANVTIKTPDLTVSIPGMYGEEGFIYQKYSKLPSSDGVHAVVGSWVIEGWAAGIGVREDPSPVTNNTSRFVPHLFY